MESGKKRRWTYVVTAIVGAMILILAVILLQQPIQNKATPPPSRVAPTVLTVAVTDVTATTATLNGNLKALGTASSVTVGFRYGSGLGATADANLTIGSQTVSASFSWSLNTLNPETSYHVVAWALGDGFTAGTLADFTTLPLIPSSETVAPSVSTTNATGIGVSNATLNGDLTDLGTASNVTVGFVYGTDASLTVGAYAAVGVMNTTGVFSWDATGLEATTTYYVKAWALGDGLANGSTLNFTTAAPSGPEAVPPAVTTLNATCIRESKATLHGDLTDLGTAASVTLGFLYGTDANLSDATNVTVDTVNATGAFDWRATGLAANTTYYVKAWAAADGFANGSVVSFTTPAVQCGHHHHHDSDEDHEGGHHDRDGCGGHHHHHGDDDEGWESGHWDANAGMRESNRYRAFAADRLRFR